MFKIVKIIEVNKKLDLKLNWINIHKIKMLNYYSHKIQTKIICSQVSVIIKLKTKIRGFIINHL